MIQLGDEVEDTITGFRGIAIARHSYIEYPNDISVQPVVGQYGELPEIQVFTESLLKVIKTKKKKTVIIKEIKGGD
jgi:hypothetical protein